MDDRLIATPRGLTRRTLLKRSAGLGAGALALGSLPSLLAACGSGGSGSGDIIPLKALTNQPPDPAPPGVAKFADAEFVKWQADNKAKVGKASMMMNWPFMWPPGAACCRVASSPDWSRFCHTDCR